MRMHICLLFLALWISTGLSAQEQDKKQRQVHAEMNSDQKGKAGVQQAFEGSPKNESWMAQSLGLNEERQNKLEFGFIWAANGAVTGIYGGLLFNLEPKWIGLLSLSMAMDGGLYAYIYAQHRAVSTVEVKAMESGWIWALSNAFLLYDALDLKREYGLSMLMASSTVGIMTGFEIAKCTLLREERISLVNAGMFWGTYLGLIIGAGFLDQAEKYSSFGLIGLNTGALSMALLAPWIEIDAKQIQNLDQGGVIGAGVGTLIHLLIFRDVQSHGKSLPIALLSGTALGIFVAYWLRDKGDARVEAVQWKMPMPYLWLSSNGSTVMGLNFFQGQF